MRLTTLLFLFFFIGENSFSQDLIPYRLDNKWGYADENGKVLIAWDYDQVMPFDENDMALVYRDGLCTYINQEGKELFPFTYTAILEFKDGLAAACKGGEYHWLQGEIIGAEWGFINEKGEEVIPFNYSRAQSFENGYAIVQTENNWGNWGVIDKTGKQILPFNYSTYSFDMRPFAGLIWDEKEKGKLLYRPSQQDEVWRQIDLKGKPTGKKVNDIHGFYSQSEEFDIRKKNNKYAAFTKGGKQLTDYIYDSYFYYYGTADFAVVSKYENNNSNGILLKGVIDKTGKETIPCEYKSIEFQNGKVILKNKDDKNAIGDFYGNINVNWTEKDIDYLGEDIYRIHHNLYNVELLRVNGSTFTKYALRNSRMKFSEGKLGVCDSTNHWGYLNTKGELVIPFKYGSVNEFENGFAHVDMNGNQYKIIDDGLINANGIEFFRNSQRLEFVYVNSKKEKCIVDEYARPLVTNVKSATKRWNGDYIYQDENNFHHLYSYRNKQLIHDDLLEFYEYQMGYDPDLMQTYFYGVSKDSMFIYDENGEKYYAEKGKLDNDNKNLLLSSGYFLRTDKNNRKYIADGFGNKTTPTYLDILPTYDGSFIATNDKKMKGLILGNGYIIIPFSSQHLFSEGELIIQSFFSGKKLTEVNFYTAKGKKINEQKIIDYVNEDRKLNLYFVTADNGRDKGYILNGKISPLIYSELFAYTINSKKIIVTNENGRYAIIDAETGNILKDNLQDVRREWHFLYLKRDGKYGIYEIKDGNLSVLISNKYENIHPVSSNTLPEVITVKLDGKYILINSNEEKVSDIQLDACGQFQPNCIFTWAIRNEDFGEGIIDNKGNWIVKPEFSDIELQNFDNQWIFYALKNNTPYLYNENGENMLPKDITRLSFDILDGEYFVAFKDKKVGLINAQGKIISPIKYDEIRNYYNGSSEGENYYVVREGKKYGMLNGLGQQILPSEYDAFEEDDDAFMAAMFNVIETKKNGKYGLISFEGKVLLPNEYDYFDWYFDEENYYSVPMKKNGKYGLVGVDGKIFVEPKYEYMSIDNEFSEIFMNEKGYALLVKLDGKYGIIDKEGTEIIPCKYSKFELNDYCKDITLSVFQGKKMGILEMEKQILPCEYKNIICELSENNGIYYIAQKSKQKEVFNAEGKAVNSNLYDHIEWDGSDNTLFYGTRNKTIYKVNSQGQEIIATDNND